MYLIEKRKLAVPINLLINCLRDQKDPDNTDTVGPIPYEDIITCEIAIHITLSEIENGLLTKYVHQGKLTLEEKNAFLNSIGNYFKELLYEGQTRNYYDYISECFPRLLSKEEYRESYRAKFEFVMKESRSIFSAKIKKLRKRY